MLLATMLLIIGLFLVVYSADRLVFAASLLCRTINISPLVVGMTVVGVGTSLPEIMVSVAAALHGQLDLAVGTAWVQTSQTFYSSPGWRHYCTHLACIPIFFAANCR